MAAHAVSPDTDGGWPSEDTAVHFSYRHGEQPIPPALVIGQRTVALVPA
jgi:hypothetical protein